MEYSRYGIHHRRQASPRNVCSPPLLLRLEDDAGVMNVFGGSRGPGVTGTVARVAGTLGPLVRCIVGDPLRAMELAEEHQRRSGLSNRLYQAM